MKNYIQDILGNILLLTAAGLMAQVLPKRKYFWLRAVASLLVLCVARYLYFSLLGSVISRQYNYLFNVFGFIVLLLLIAVAVFACYDCRIWAALFCGSTSYCIQHVTQMLYRIFSRLWLNDKHAALYILLYVSIALLLLVAVFFVLKRVKYSRIILNNQILFIGTILMISTSIIIDLLWPRALRNNPDLIRYYFYIYSSIICLLIFLLQLNMVTNKKTEWERDIIKKMSEEEREQYNFEKSIIDMVNIKCHDLKHQIAKLDTDAASQLKDDIKPVIEAYDNCFKTGNTALDVVLTRKTFSCKDKNIQLTCLADGGRLNFMTETDVYSLFGNILDNAIEAVEKLDDKSKRLITMSVKQDGYFVNIHEENYFTGKLIYGGGELKTTKPDSMLHGFGLKSIRMIADSYGGSTKIKTDKDRFILDILLPV